MDAGIWAAASATSLGDWARADRRSRAQAAARLRAVDAPTLAQLVTAITFDGATKEIALGWLRGRRCGMVALATQHHTELARLLCIAAQPHIAGARCTTVVLRAGGSPNPPRAASGPLATCVVRDVAAPENAKCDWAQGAHVARSIGAHDVAIAFYDVPLSGAREQRAAAALHRLGFSVWA